MTYNVILMDVSIGKVSDILHFIYHLTYLGRALPMITLNLKLGMFFLLYLWSAKLQ